MCHRILRDGTTWREQRCALMYDQSLNRFNVRNAAMPVPQIPADPFHSELSVYSSSPLQLTFPSLYPVLETCNVGGCLGDLEVLLTFQIGIQRTCLCLLCSTALYLALPSPWLSMGAKFALRLCFSRQYSVTARLISALFSRGTLSGCSLRSTLEWVTSLTLCKLVSLMLLMPSLAWNSWTHSKRHTRYFYCLSHELTRYLNSQTEHAVRTNIPSLRRSRTMIEWFCQ